MSTEGESRRVPDLLKRRSSRRQALKGAAAVGFGAPLLRFATASAQSPVTITWFAARDTTGYTPKQVAAFNAQSTTIKINYQEQGATTTDLHDKFVTLATAKDSTADMISMDVPFVPEFGAAGWTIPVEDIVPASERGQFFGGTIAGATYDGKLYAIPWYNNGPGLFYRKDLLDGAGLQPPKTYDELVSISKKLQTPQTSGFVFQAVQTEGGLISWLEYLWGYGGELLDKDMKVVLDKSDLGTQSLTRLVGYIYDEKISPESCLTMKIAADAENAFASGGAVFLRSWMTATSTMEGDASKVKGKWDVTTLPSQDGAKPGPGCLGTWNLGISAFSKHQKEAAEAIKWLTSLEQQTARYLANGNLPARSAVFDDPKVKAKYSYVDRLKPAFEALKPRPVTPYYSQLSSDALQPNYGAAMTKQQTPEQAIKAMADGMRKVLAG